MKLGNQLVSVPDARAVLCCTGHTGKHHLKKFELVGLLRATPPTLAQVPSIRSPRPHKEAWINPQPLDSWLLIGFVSGVVDLGLDLAKFWVLWALCKQAAPCRGFSPIGAWELELWKPWQRWKIPGAQENIPLEIFWHTRGLTRNALEWPMATVPEIIPQDHPIDFVPGTLPYHFWGGSHRIPGACGKPGVFGISQKSNRNPGSAWDVLELLKAYQRLSNHLQISGESLREYGLSPDESGQQFNRHRLPFTN